MLIEQMSSIQLVNLFMFGKIGFNQKNAPRKYVGPYQVIQRLNDSVYRVQNPMDLNEIMNIHINRIRRCYQWRNSAG